MKTHRRRSLPPLVLATALLSPLAAGAVTSVPRIQPLLQPELSANRLLIAGGALLVLAGGLWWSSYRTSHRNAPAAETWIEALFLAMSAVAMATVGAMMLLLGLTWKLIDYLLSRPRKERKPSRGKIRWGP